MWAFSFCMMQTQHVINYESENRTGNTSKNGLNDIHSNWHMIQTKTRPARPQKDYYAAKIRSRFACMWVYVKNKQGEIKRESKVGCVGQMRVLKI